MVTLNATQMGLSYSSQIVSVYQHDQDAVFFLQGISTAERAIY